MAVDEDLRTSRWPNIFDWATIPLDLEIADTRSSTLTSLQKSAASILSLVKCVICFWIFHNTVLLYQKIGWQLDWPCAIQVTEQSDLTLLLNTSRTSDVPMNDVNIYTADEKSQLNFQFVWTTVQHIYQRAIHVFIVHCVWEMLVRLSNTNLPTSCSSFCPVWLQCS